MPFLKGHKPWNKGKKCPGLGGAPKGLTPWNKGKRWKEMEGNQHAFRGNNATKWAGHKRANKFLAHIKYCQKCKKKKNNYQLPVHHKNGNQLDNRLSNLIKLCRACHINHHRSKLKEAKIKKYGNAYGIRIKRKIPRV